MRGRRVRVLNLANGRQVCSGAGVADRFLSRALGLMFRRAWGEMDGLLLSPCASVHTGCMRMAIDVCFLDRQCNVVSVAAGLRPWRAARGGRGSRHTLELPCGALDRAGVAPGDRLRLLEE